MDPNFPSASAFYCTLNTRYCIVGLSYCMHNNQIFPVAGGGVIPNENFRGSVPHCLYSSMPENSMSVAIDSIWRLCDLLVIAF